MIEVKIPELSESVAEASLGEWQKKPGDAVQEGDLLVVVETDKIALEVPSPVAGVLAKIHKASGDAVSSGEPLAAIDDSVVPADTAPSDTAPSPKPDTSPSEQASLPAQPEQTAAPSAKKIAAEQGVNLADLAGSGKGGRITKGDVLSAMAGGGSRVEQRVAMSKLRARIAERLMQSQNDTASLTTFNEVNMQAVIDVRTAYRDQFAQKHGVKLGFMSFFVKAAIHALQQYPIINAAVDGSDMVYHEYYDIGVAVGTPRGLVVPIVRNAERLSLAAIEQTIADFGKRAQTGALTMEEISGGTFSITNGGVFGSMLSTPIINPPQSAIMGIHATKPRPVAENGEVVIRPINYLALSYDHRIIDGREAVLFLVAVKDALEDPVRL
ncbi:MAG: 2-oxoglutarate dehydrogenase complex dihydrolipoyllysine-residue succinyltransferase, partial [Gammaproteobacteria bacterium]